MTATISPDPVLRGQEHLAHGSAAGIDDAVACFELAIAQEPTNARAFVGLSQAYRQRALSLGLGRAWLGEAVCAGELAIALRPDLTEARRALAQAYYAKGWWRKYLDVNRALAERDPGDASALRDTGWALWFTGRAEEGLPLLERAAELDPAFRWSHFWIGNASLALGLWSRAEEMYRLAAESKNLSSAHLGLICTYVAQGKDEQARVQNERFRANPDKDRYFVKAADAELLLGSRAEARTFAERAAAEDPGARYMPRGVYPTTILGCVLWDEDQAEARRHLERSELQDRRSLAEGDDGPMPRYDLAAVHAVRGETAEGLGWLRRALDAGWRPHRLAARDPLLRNLHGESGFKRLIEDDVAR